MLSHRNAIDHPRDDLGTRRKSQRQLNGSPDFQGMATPNYTTLGIYEEYLAGLRKRMVGDRASDCRRDVARNPRTTAFRHFLASRHHAPDLVSVSPPDGLHVPYFGTGKKKGR